MIRFCLCNNTKLDRLSVWWPDQPQSCIGLVWTCAVIQVVKCWGTTVLQGVPPPAEKLAGGQVQHAFAKLHLLRTLAISPWFIFHASYTSYISRFRYPRKKFLCYFFVLSARDCGADRHDELSVHYATDMLWLVHQQNIDLQHVRP